MSIGSSSPELISWLKQFGGGVSEYKPNKLGKKTVWQWYVASHSNVLELLNSTYPYMVIKKEKALLAIAEIKKRTEKLELCRNGIHDLRKTGRIYADGTRKCLVCKNDTSRRWRERQKERK